MEVKFAVFVLPSTCSSLILFLDFFEMMFYHQHHSLPRNLNCFSLPAAPRECTAELGRAGWHVEKKGRNRDTQGEWSMQKKKNVFKKDTIYSQGKQMDHASDLPQKKRNSIYIHNQSRRQELFSMSLFYPVGSFSLFYQGCDSKESKNQQLKLGVILYTALSQ